MEATYKEAENHYGSDLLNLVVAKGYLTNLLANAAVKSYIERKEPEILSHLELVANINSMEEAVLREFFGEALGQQLAANGQQADLIAGNNVYAHVPDINDFTRGLKAALKPSGTITLEFPHLMQLIEHTQFDTVYHEHFSYLSLYTVSSIFKASGLRIWDVEQLPTHGGSLRIFGCHADDTRTSTPAVATLLAEEAQRGLQALATYQNFQAKADKVKDDLLSFLIDQKRAGKKVAAYGAAAKGNTLLNYAGVKSDLLPLVCDAAQAKQGKYMPGMGWFECGLCTHQYPFHVQENTYTRKMALVWTRRITALAFSYYYCRFCSLGYARKINCSYSHR